MVLLALSLGHLTNRCNEQTKSLECWRGEPGAHLVECDGMSLGDDREVSRIYRGQVVGRGYMDNIKSWAILHRRYNDANYSDSQSIVMIHPK